MELPEPKVIEQRVRTLSYVGVWTKMSIEVDRVNADSELKVGRWKILRMRVRPSFRSSVRICMQLFRAAERVASEERQR